MEGLLASAGCSSQQAKITVAIAGGSCSSSHSQNEHNRTQPEEALYSVSLGAMGSLLRKLDELPEFPNIWKLREDVGIIRSKLVRLSEIHDPPLTVNYWTRDARELSYDIEDCVDQFVHADEDAKMAWMDEISGFSTRAEEVRERYDRFKLEHVFSRPVLFNTVASYQLGAVDSEHNSIVPVGMEGPENEVLRWLEPNGDDENEMRLKVVSILGGVGVGKSTLVQKLWRKLAEGSECRAFVQVGKRPDMRMILGSILSQVRPHQPPEVCQVPNLVHDIRKHLQHKRYFVIIDDIWAVSVWDALSRAFSDDYCCSRIITTTAIEDVALACCSYDPVHIFKMKPLSVDHSKELFTSTVFGSGNGCPQQRHDVSDVIVRKCGGLPLAITCIATLVARLPETLQQWEYVQNFLCENLRANSTSDEVLKQVMKLCYSCLPQYLKTCLLYLSVYPENYIILKEDLVQQWIVEGFICAVEGKDNIEIAQNSFDELISLGLIQQIDRNSMKKGLSYAVHPVVFDFITCKSIEDNYITVIDYSQTTIQLTDKVRRLSLHFGSATYATTPASIGLSQIRSFVFMGLLNCMPSLEEYMLVRVVILHFRGEDAETSFPLKEICGLPLLRYLQIRCNVTVELPDQIQCLKRLETLEIDARIAAVPSDIFHISSLLHVRLGGKTNPTVAPVFSWKVVSLEDSSSASFPPIFLRKFEFLPPICIFSRLPEWIRQLRKLRVLKIVVGELLQNDISVLTELPALAALSLYVRTPIARHIFFSKVEFPALEYFKFVCSGLLLGFREEAMPNLRRFKIGFNAQRGGEYSYMLAGIHYLLNLKEVEAKIGADNGAEEPDRRAAESAFKDAFGMHPRHPNVKVKRVDRVNQEYVSSDKQNWSQLKESSNERENVQRETQNEEPLVEQPKMLGKMPKHDTTEHDNIWISQFSNPPEVHSSIRQKSVVAPRNITLKSFEEVMSGSSKEYKVGSSRYAEDADQSGNVYTSELIREIGRLLSIECLLRLPRSDYYNLACVNRSFYSLVRSGEIYRWRRKDRIVEQMIYCSCNVLEWDGFDPCRRRWFSIPSMPAKECFTLADKESLAVGTNILVFGRRVEVHVVLRYSLLTNSWTTGEMMNTPRCLFGSASFGEKAIVAGGIGENGTLSSAEIYDSEMQTWTTLPSMNRARHMCSGFFMDGKFYVIGGKAEKHNEILSCAEEFDLVNGTWRLIPDMAGGLIGRDGTPPLVAVVNNELYVADYEKQEVKVRKYDKENNAWITLGSLPGRYTSVHGWGLAFRSCGDMLIVIGGMSVGGSGVIEICSWVPNNGLPDWKIIGTRHSGSFVYNCAVMSC